MVLGVGCSSWQKKRHASNDPRNTQAGQRRTTNTQHEISIEYVMQSLTFKNNGDTLEGRRSPCHDPKWVMDITRTPSQIRVQLVLFELARQPDTGDSSRLLYKTSRTKFADVHLSFAYLLGLIRTRLHGLDKKAPRSSRHSPNTPAGPETSHLLTNRYSITIPCLLS